MGFLRNLLTFPVSGPIHGTTFIARKILEQAENELYDPNKVKRGLMELEARYDMGEIDDDEYDRLEAELLQRLKMIQQRRMG